MFAVTKSLMTLSLEQAIDSRCFREAVEQANLLLATAARGARGRLHLQRLTAIDRGALGDVETREKEALAAVSSPSEAIDVRLTLGRIALRRGNFAMALQLGVSMKTLLPPHDKVRLARALRLEATAKWSQGALHESIALHGNAAALCAEANDALGAALALNDRGLVRGYAGDYLRALEDHEAAERSLNSVESGPLRDEAQAQISNDHGFSLWNLGRHNDALRLLEQALSLRHGLNDVYGQGTTNNNIGNVHRSCGRTEQAVKSYEAAIVMCRQSVNPLYEAIALNNLGQMAMDQGDLLVAESRLQDALSITQRVGDKIRQADNYGNLGAIYLRTGATERALEVLEKAVQMRRELRDLAYLVVDQSALAVALARHHDRAAAEDTVAEVEEALNRGQQGIEQPQAVYLNLYWAHQSLGATDDAGRALLHAQQVVRELSEKLPTEAARTAFLNNVAVNREINSLQ